MTITDHDIASIKQRYINSGDIAANCYTEYFNNDKNPHVSPRGNGTDYPLHVTIRFVDRPVAPVHGVHAAIYMRVCHIYVNDVHPDGSVLKHEIFPRRLFTDAVVA